MKRNAWVLMWVIACLFAIAAAVTLEDRLLGYSLGFTLMSLMTGAWSIVAYLTEPDDEDEQ